MKIGQDRKQMKIGQDRERETKITENVQEKEKEIKIREENRGQWKKRNIILHF